MPILFSAALNWLFRLDLICGNAGETESQLCPGWLPPESALRGGGPGYKRAVIWLVRAPSSKEGWCPFLHQLTTLTLGMHLDPSQNNAIRYIQYK